MPLDYDDVGSNSNDWWTPLTLCIYRGYNHLIPLLLEYGAKFDPVDQSYMTNERLILDGENWDAIKILIDNNVGFNFEDYYYDDKLFNYKYMIKEFQEEIIKNGLVNQLIKLENDIESFFILDELKKEYEWYIESDELGII